MISYKKDFGDANNDDSVIAGLSIICQKSKSKNQKSVSNMYFLSMKSSIMAES